MTEQTPTGKRTIKITVRGSVNGYIGRKFWVNLGDAYTRQAERAAEEFLAGEVK